MPYRISRAATSGRRVLTGQPEFLTLRVMGWGKAVSAVALAVLAACAARAEAPLPAAPKFVSSIYVVRSDHWSEGDERDYSRFIAAIGEFGLRHGRQMPAQRRQSVPRQRSGRHLFPLRLRRPCLQSALLFRLEARPARSAMSATSACAGAGAISATASTATRSSQRTTVPSGVESGYEIWDEIRDNVSSGTFRIHPDARGARRSRSLFARDRRRNRSGRVR